MYHICVTRKLLAYLARRAQLSVDTTMGRNLAMINIQYGIKLWLYEYNKKSFKDILFDRGINPAAQQVGCLLRECCQVRDGEMCLEGFTRDEVNTVIFEMSTA